MGLLAVICIVLGAWAIVWRGPLIFAPGVTTLRFYDRLVLSTNTRCRVCGVVIGILATALLLFSLGEGELSSLLQAFGWIVVAMALWALVLPDGFRRFGLAMVSFFEPSGDEAALRVIGLLNVVFGAVLIYIGVYVV